MKIQHILSSALLILLASFSSCNKESEANTFEEVTLSIGSNLNNNETSRIAFYDVNQNGKPFAKLTFGKNGDTHKVYTVITRGNHILYRNNLDWTVARDGTRLEYKGGLKLNIRYPNETTDPTLNLIAIPHNGNISISNTALVYNQDNVITEVSSAATNYSTANDKMDMPYVMTTTVKRKSMTGSDSRVLVNADLSTSKFKPYGNLVRFRVTNQSSKNISIHGVGIAPYYVPTMNVSILNGRYTFQYRYNKDGAPHYIEKNPASRLLLRPNEVSNTLQFWTPIYHPNNELSSLPTTETAPTAPLFVYVFEEGKPDRRRMVTTRLSSMTTNAQRFGKQLFYEVTVQDDDLVDKH